MACLGISEQTVIFFFLHLVPCCMGEDNFWIGAVLYFLCSHEINSLILIYTTTVNENEILVTVSEIPYLLSSSRHKTKL